MTRRLLESPPEEMRKRVRRAVGDPLQNVFSNPRGTEHNASLFVLRWSDREEEENAAPTVAD
jgi:hypothetical protein